MPRQLIIDVHEWNNEIPAVPNRGPANQQPRERAWNSQRGKKTLLSLTLVRHAPQWVGCRIGGMMSFNSKRIVWSQTWNTTAFSFAVLTKLCITAPQKCSRKEKRFWRLKRRQRLNWLLTRSVMWCMLFLGFHPKKFAFLFLFNTDV